MVPQRRGAQLRSRADVLYPAPGRVGRAATHAGMECVRRASCGPDINLTQRRGPNAPLFPPFFRRLVGAAAPALGVAAAAQRSPRCRSPPTRRSSARRRRFRRQAPDVAVDLHSPRPCATQDELDALRDSLADCGAGRHRGTSATPAREDGRGSASSRARLVSPELRRARRGARSHRSGAQPPQRDRGEPPRHRPPREPDRSSLLRRETSSLKLKIFGPDGPRVRFVAPDKVVTTIKGKDTRPFPDVTSRPRSPTCSPPRRRVYRTTKTQTRATPASTRRLRPIAAHLPGERRGPRRGLRPQLALIQHGIAAQNAGQANSGPGTLLAQQVFRRDIALSRAAGRSSISASPGGERRPHRALLPAAGAAGELSADVASPTGLTGRTRRCTRRDHLC